MSCKIEHLHAVITQQSLAQVYIPMSDSCRCATGAICEDIQTRFKLAKSWGQPTSPMVEEWISKLWYSQTIEHYTAMKMNEPQLHTAT